MSLLSCRSEQKGVALVAVLWIVMACSVMVMGLSHVLKHEVRTSRQLQDAALKTAAADAAIRLAMVEVKNQGQTRLGAIQRKGYDIFQNQVTVDMVPLNGWINLNSAPEGLITDALVRWGNMPGNEARSVALWILEERKLPELAGGSRKFHAVDELVRAPGMSYDTFLAIRSLFTVDLQGGGPVNPAAAPPPVLTVLAGGQGSVAQQILDNRVGQGAMTDFTRLQGGNAQVTDTDMLQIEARIALSDNTHVLRIWRVALSGEAYGLPWRVLSIEPPVIAKNETSP